MSVAAFLAVGIGGAFGALCRSKATSLLKPRFSLGNSIAHPIH